MRGVTVDEDKVELPTWKVTVLEHLTYEVEVEALTADEAEKRACARVGDADEDPVQRVIDPVGVELV